MPSHYGTLVVFLTDTHEILSSAPHFVIGEYFLYPRSRVTFHIL